MSGTVHVVWGECLGSEPEGSARLIYYRYLKDGVWSTPIDIVTTPPGRSIASPVLQATSDGRLHLAWVEPVYYAYETYYSWALATDAASARAWAAPRFVHASGPVIDFNAENDGTLRVVCALDDPPGVFLATSRDLGRTWSAARIHPQPADLVRLAVGEQRTVHVVWQRDDNSEGTLATIYAARSTDDGATWSEPFTVDRKAAGDARYTETYRPIYPSIAAVGRHEVHIVWDGAPSGQRWHRWSADNGSTWSDAVQVDPLMRALTWPNPLAVDSAQLVHLVSVGHDWTQDGVGGVWYDWWDRERRAWSPPRLIDDEYRNDYHEADAAVGLGNRIYAVFEDHRSASTNKALEFDIWFLEGRTGAPPEPAQELPEPVARVSPTAEPTAAPSSRGASAPAPTAAGSADFAQAAQTRKSAISPATLGLLVTVAVLAVTVAVSQRRRRS